MDKSNEKINEIQARLKKAGFSNLAGLYEIGKRENEICRIGVVGDYVTGKSKVINEILDSSLLRTSIIPDDVMIVVKHGEKTGIIGESGEILDIEEIDQLMENSSQLVVSSDSEILSGCELIEFPGLISKKNIQNLEAMSELYKCDAAILVISADHLFSETECSFIENYGKYVGLERLLIVINKLDIIAEDEISRILKFTAKQRDSRFPDGKICLLGDNHIEVGNMLLGISAIREAVKEWKSSGCIETNTKSIQELDKYVRGELENYITKIRNEMQIDNETREAMNKKVIQDRELEKGRLENILLEFEGRRNDSLQDVDKYLREAFKKLERSILKGYENSSDKYIWYKETLPCIWERDMKRISEKADQHIINCIHGDIGWLNEESMLHTETGIELNKIFDTQADMRYEGKEYGKIKKIVPIGIGGSVIIGFCLFKIVGASICLGGGVLFNYYLNFISDEQDRQIKQSIQDDIQEVAKNALSLSDKEIKSIYEEISKTFRDNITKYVNEKYEIIENVNNFEDKVDELEEILALI